MKPTGREMGTVLGADKGYCYVAMEKWFTDSETFRTRGTWRESAGAAPRVGESLFMERADGRVAECVIVEKVVSQQ